MPNNLELQENLCSSFIISSLSTSAQSLHFPARSGKFSVIISDNTMVLHRISEVIKDLWRSSSPSLILTQVQLEQVAQFCVQLDFEYLQG